MHKTDALNISVFSPWCYGRMLMQMLGSFAEFEREMIRERTRAGLERARKEGRVGGRRPKLTAEQQREARRSYVVRFLVPVRNTLHLRRLPFVQVDEVLGLRGKPDK